MLSLSNALFENNYENASERKYICSRELIDLGRTCVLYAEMNQRGCCNWEGIRHATDMTEGKMKEISGSCFPRSSSIQKESISW